MKIPIEISARHIHLSQKDAGILFGLDYQFTKLKDISQPEQYSTEEVIQITSVKDILDKVRIIMPFRQITQLELSKTDCIKLGIDAPVKMSGDLDNSVGGIKIIGPKGNITLNSGVIIAKRHLHIEPETAKELNIFDGQIISIKNQGERSITFHDVIVRSRRGQDKLSFMIDTDEANAAGVKNGDEGEVV